MFTGSNDALADPTDVKLLETQMDSSLIVFSKNVDYYQHLDFTWGLDTNTTIYPDIVKMMKTFFPEN